MSALAPSPTNDPIQGLLLLNSLLEEHYVDTNPERHAQEEGEENPSRCTTPVFNAGIGTRRLDARHRCDDVDPEWNLRLVSDSIRRHGGSCHITDAATDTPEQHDAQRFMSSHAMRLTIREPVEELGRVGPDGCLWARRLYFGPVFRAWRREIVETRYCLIQIMAANCQSCPSGGRNRSELQPMTSRCLDCSLPIEEEPWWYDPAALAMNDGAQAAQPTAASAQRPYPPTSVSGPFHKACLARRKGHKRDSLAWS